jgi:hypothetical protein
MSSFWIMAVAAAAPAKHQPAGVPYLTIFGIVGTVIGILAAIQQFTSSVRRRRFQGAEENFLRAVESSKTISESLTQVEQYKRVKDSLRNEIETQIPKQARVAYLSNRLEQLKDDLYRSYRDYETVRKELGKDQDTSELDRSIRDAVSSSLPTRRVQEIRNLYMLSLVIVLLLFNLSPQGPDIYFRAIANSTDYAASDLIFLMAAGALVLVLVWLLLLSFVPSSSRIILRFQSLSGAWKTALLACPVLIAGLAITIGFILWDHGTYVQYVQYNDPWEFNYYAKEAFNVAVIAFSIGIAVPISLRQRRVWQGGIGFRRR